jgi:hypothetical protein
MHSWKSPFISKQSGFYCGTLCMKHGNSFQLKLKISSDKAADRSQNDEWPTDSGTWLPYKLSPFGTSALNWSIALTPVDRWIWSIWWNENWQGNWSILLLRKLVPRCNGCEDWYQEQDAKSSLYKLLLIVSSVTMLGKNNNEKLLWC